MKTVETRIILRERINSSGITTAGFLVQPSQLDTVDDYISELPDLEFENVKVNTISRLIRKKVFESGKFRGHYIVAIDGTGIASFENRRCESCLSKNSKNGVTSYFYNVLEAMLLTPSGMSLSTATEWISNQGKKSYQKQDCEQAAFIRLGARLKNYYPRLPMVIVADGLYPLEGFFDVCRQKGVYWVSLFLILKDQFFDVYLVNAKHVKNVTGRKDD